jgi:hypothetical protein
MVVSGKNSSPSSFIAWHIRLRDFGKSLTSLLRTSQWNKRNDKFGREDTAEQVSLFQKNLSALVDWNAEQPQQMFLVSSVSVVLRGGQGNFVPSMGPALQWKIRAPTMASAETYHRFQDQPISSTLSISCELFSDAR